MPSCNTEIGSNILHQRIKRGPPFQKAEFDITILIPQQNCHPTNLPKIHTNDEEEKTNVEGTNFRNHTYENLLDAESFTNAPTDPADPTGHASTVVAQVDTICVLSPTPLRVIKPPIENATDPVPAKGVTPTDKADSTLEKDMSKSFQPTSDMLVEFEDPIPKDSPISKALATRFL
ncbi:hypothetical protein V6N13_088690 [Hibiscus sabdariffa]|uniref:Uncharacterized protein n=1 Tax=Hibiscus sabdariffa TaxID=183260 RepID=A0ABR2G028_9ROSI